MIQLDSVIGLVSATITELLFLRSVSVSVNVCNMKIVWKISKETVKILKYFMKYFMSKKNMFFNISSVYRP